MIIMDRWDLLIIITVVMKSILVFLTNFFLSLTARVTGASVAQVARVMEINPLANLYMQLYGIVGIWESLAFPAFIVSFWYYIRYSKGRGTDVSPELRSVLIFLFVISFMNVLSDAAQVVGLLMRI